ncbi:hypothetical protein CDAR_70141 [Caerostris darwini]|uniref:Secreted protein n=1 Tax=Caerostris darwini TaxID=1538125 RepID=A0AAV4T985_9ARAC|nr:hypothetical protein CDAR_70141 [Caerostris darwini]
MKLTVDWSISVKGHSTLSSSGQASLLLLLLLMDLYVMKTKMSTSEKKHNHCKYHNSNRCQKRHIAQQTTTICDLTMRGDVLQVLV